MNNKFHQFVRITKGIKNTAIIDFLTKNVYQIPNYEMPNDINTITKSNCNVFEQLIEANLLIKINKQKWIPNEDTVFSKKTNESFYELYLDKGVCKEFIKSILSNYKISRIYSDRSNWSFIENEFSIKTKELNSDYDHCKKRLSTSTKFRNISLNEYEFNKVYNSCWGKKIVIDRKQFLKPCFYSNIRICKINNVNVNKILNKLDRYWYLNKDKVNICKKCEFKYICFDCREIAFRKNKNLYSSNPQCDYNPITGKWNR